MYLTKGRKRRTFRRRVSGDGRTVGPVPVYGVETREVGRIVWRDESRVV